MNKQIYPALIIGAGASGLFASSILGRKALVLDSNNTSGKKLALTGGGRCNYTHASTPDELLEHYRGPKAAIKRIIYSFPPEKIIKYFKELGIDEEITDEGKVFPKHGDAISIIEALSRNSDIRLGEKVISVEKSDEIFTIATEKSIYKAYNVIVATGCNAYKETGSDGRGIEILKQFGHEATPFTPALAPIELERNLKSAENITLDLVLKCGKEQYSGSAMITKRGLTGPAAQNISYLLSKKREIEICFCEISKEEIKRKNGKLLLKNALLLPPRLSEAVLKDIANKKIAELTKKDLETIERELMRYRTAARAIDGGAMTSYGGALLEDFDLKTMESKKASGLYASGDILSPSADSGGYSLTFTFATAYIAASAIERSLENSDCNKL